MRQPECRAGADADGVGRRARAALEVVGNLAFCAANRAGLLATDGLLPLVVRLVASDEASTKAIVRTAAIRALAILGAHVLQVA